MRKGLIVLLGILILGSNSVMAKCDYTCPEQRDMSPKFSRVVSNISTTTFFTKLIAQTTIKKQIKKAIDEGKLSVKLQSFSGADLLGGRFKSLAIKGNNLSLGGVAMSKLEVATLCDFNYINIDGEYPVFKEPMYLSYNMEMSNSDLNRTLIQTKYLDRLNNINVSGYGISLLKISNVETKLENSQLHLIFEVESSFFKTSQPVKFDTTAKLKVVDGRVQITEIQNMSKRVDLSQLANVLNYMNIFNFEFELFQGAKTHVIVKDVDIVGNKLITEGIFYIPATESK